MGKHAKEVEFDAAVGMTRALHRISDTGQLFSPDKREMQNILSREDSQGVVYKLEGFR